MTDTEIIIEVAKLDGWGYANNNTLLVKGLKDRTRQIDLALVEKHLSSYLTSRDAIIPVIEKVFSKITCHSFFDSLGIEVAKETADCDGQYEWTGDGSYYEMWLIFKATPRQLCIALLKATGKWKA